MGNGFSVSGTANVLANIDKFVAATTNRVDQAVQGAGIDTQAVAKVGCPVDTGRLRSSIQYVRIGLCMCEVATNLKYAAPVELGHVTRSGSFVAARPYMFPGYLKAKAGLKSELNSIPGIRVVSWS